MNLIMQKMRESRRLLKKRFLSLMGLTILELMIVVAVIGILLLFAIPNFISSQGKIYKGMCIDNLRRIHTAKELFAVEHNKNKGDSCLSSNIDPYIQGGTASLFCPLDPNKTFATSYLINNIGTNTPPTCKINGEHTISP